MTFEEKLIKLNQLNDRYRTLTALYNADITNSFSEETIEEKINIISEITNLLQTLTDQEYEIYATGFIKVS